MAKRKGMGIILIPLAACLSIVLFPYIGWSAADLNYQLIIEHPGSGEAIIRMTVSNLSSDIFEVEEHGTQDFYINVLSLSARDAEGTDLAVEHFPDSGTCNTYFGSCADLWRIHCAGNSRIIIEYVVRPGVKHKKYDWPVGLIGPDFAMFSGERVFLVPKPEAGSFDSVHVSFVLPPGWAACTPWPQEGDKYNPFLAVDYTSQKTLDGLCLSTLAFGQFEYSMYMAGSTEVRVAAYSSWSTEIKNHLVQSSRQIFEYLTSVWGASVGDIYLAIWAPTTEDGKRIGGGEWFNSRGDCVYIYSDGSFYVDWHEFAHQVFHRWGGFGTWDLAGEGWFIEGPDVFYEWKIGTRFPLTGHYGNMEEEIGQYYEQYLEEYVYAGLDAPVAVREHDGSNYPTDYFIRYYKAAMVNFLIAKEIVRLTNGQYTFNNLLQSLLRKYQEHQISDWYSETVRAELGILTGTDWIQFFDDYVYGTVALPMEWAFGDDDGDGLSNANEIGWDKNPLKKDSHGSVTAGDLDGNGRSDLAGATFSGQVYYSLDLSNWSYLAGSMLNLTCGDFNGDGGADLAGISTTGEIFYTLDLTTWRSVPGRLSQLTAGDFNGDGREDLAGVTTDGQIFYTLDLSNWLLIAGKLSWLAAGDLDGDGRDDLIGITADGQIFHTTDLASWQYMSGSLSQLACGDLNGDGRDDVVGVTSTEEIYYSLDGANWHSLPGKLSHLAAGDLDGDGVCDVVGLTGAGEIFYTTDMNGWQQIPGRI